MNTTIPKDLVREILNTHTGHKRANYIITCPCRAFKSTRIRLDKDLLKYACDVCKSNVLAYKLQYDTPAEKPIVPMIKCTSPPSIENQSPLDLDKDQVQRMVSDLMCQHGLARQGWIFRWDNATSRAGICRYNEKEICLSKHMLQRTMEDIRNIALHEIAHALTPGHGHDDHWKEVAIRIGCDGKRCHTLGPLGKPKYKLSCSCGAVKGTRFRLDNSLFHKMCKMCRKPVIVGMLRTQ